MLLIKRVSRFTIGGNRFYCTGSEDKALTKTSKVKSNLTDLLKSMTTSNDNLTETPLGSKNLKPKHIGRNKIKYFAPKPAEFITLEVLGSGANGTATSLYLKADGNRYLFNCGEASQRLSQEFRRKSARVQNIFITSNRWKILGGLPGYALTLQSKGVRKLNIYGPPNIGKLFRSIVKFSYTNYLYLSYPSTLDNKFHEDGVIKIHFIPVFSQKNQKEGRLTEGETNQTLQTTSHQDVSICYICEPKKPDENSVVETCQEQGISAEETLEQLRGGIDVTLPDGKMLIANDFTNPDSMEQFFIIVDCPTDEYIPSLVTNPVWTKYQKQNLEQESWYPKPQIIVHFTPEKVLLDPRYVAWMESFESSTEHLLLNDSCRSLGGELVHRFQYKLNIIDNKVFPLLYTQDERTKTPVSINSPSQFDGESESDSDSDFTLSESDREPLVIPSQLQHIKVPLILGETMLRYNLRPQEKLNNTRVLRLNPEKYKEEVLAGKNFQECCDDYQNAQRCMDKNINHQELPNILCLGTGSSVPDRIRNVSSILLQMTADTRMMLDCGEGTYNQLMRFYGPEEARRVLVELTALYISHLHADHYLGFISILQARQEAFQQLNVPFVPLTLIAPYHILHLIAVYSQFFEYIKGMFSFVSHCSLGTEYAGDYPIRDKKTLFDSLGFKNIETIPVRHPANAYAIALEHKSGWKIIYTGDTMPCDEVVILGKDSDVCIHEATMADEMYDLATLNQHSTTSQAIEIGRRMNAKFTLLTHFSQRYAHLPKIEGELSPNVGVTYDNMLVRLTDLPKLPLMYPVWKCMAAEHYQRLEEKLMKKKLRLLNENK